MIITLLVIIAILLALHTTITIVWYNSYSTDRKRRITWYLDTLKDRADWKKRWYFIMNWIKIKYCLNHKNLFIWDDIKNSILKQHKKWHKHWLMFDKNWNEIWIFTII